MTGTGPTALRGLLRIGPQKEVEDHHDGLPPALENLSAAGGQIFPPERDRVGLPERGVSLHLYRLFPAIMAHPAVLEAAVIGVPRPKWQERPLGCVVAKPGVTVSEDGLKSFLQGKVKAGWWIPRPLRLPGCDSQDQRREIQQEGTARDGGLGQDPDPRIGARLALPCRT